MRRGQLQTLEPVLVVIFIGILLGVGMLVFVRMGSFRSSQEATLVQEQEALVLLKRLTTLPELSCPAAVTVQTFCIDEEKARQFALRMDDPRERAHYFPLLGASEITLEIVDLDGGVQELAVYNATIGNRTVVGSGTYFTAYDPAREERRFAILTLRREFG
jgi:hypothetical protein